MPAIQELGKVPHPHRHSKPDGDAATGSKGTAGAEQQQAGDKAAGSKEGKRALPVKASVTKEDAIWVVALFQKLAGWLTGTCLTMVLGTVGVGFWVL
jgi:hypothetical protein